MPDDCDKEELRRLRYPADRYARPLWIEHKDQVLDDWLQLRPGARPHLWWEYDAPREKAIMQGRQLPLEVAIPRKRLGGIGTPAFECLAFKPYYRYGVPAIWMWDSIVEYFKRATDGKFEANPIDWDNPPIYESEAQYLKFHQLFFPGEEQRLVGEEISPERLSHRHLLYGSEVRIQ